MRFPLLTAGFFSILCTQVAAKTAFAHFMLSNSDEFETVDWEVEMQDAMAAGIDAFMLNFAYDEDTTVQQIPPAFVTATRLGFKLAFSFDYAGNGPWPKADVIKLIKTWSVTGAYVKHEGSKPLVSAFEGPDQSEDWKDIKKETNCFFIPSWSSLGAKRALDKGTADGLFNWAAWPVGSLEMDTYTDASYIQYLRDEFGTDAAARKRYMMPVSPWFYTNLPQYNKNWMWRSDDLWYTRWQQVLDVDPEYVQIISWNDFGESHYIGRVRDSGPFRDRKIAYDYVSDDMSHDAWRRTIPAWLSLWKKGTTTVAKEELVVWYLLHEDGGCNDGGTTINTATHIQLEYPTSKVPGGGNIFFDAILTGPADVVVKFNGRTEKSYFTQGPQKGAGVYHGRQFIERDQGKEGRVEVELSRNGRVFISFLGRAIGGCGPNGYRNFNPWVGAATSPIPVTAMTSSPKVSDLVCTQGWGAGKINTLCRTTCGMGYCPLGACVCSQSGTIAKVPEDKFPMGYTRGDPNWIGLCSFACTKGYCLTDFCSDVEMPIVEPTVSPFLPTVCSEGRAKDPSDLAASALCEDTCKYGHCPIAVCTCIKQGLLKEIQSEHTKKAGVVGSAQYRIVEGKHPGAVAINNMCAFGCPYGFCPPAACTSTNENGGDNGGNSDYQPPAIYDRPVRFCPFIAFKSMEDLVDNFSSIEEQYCIPQHILWVAIIALGTITTSFNEIIKADYDKYFGYYATYVAKQSPTVMKAFLNKQSDRYFTCEVVEEVFCCDGCHFEGNLNCRYCKNTADVCEKGPYVNGQLPSIFEKKRQPCPPQYQERGNGDVNVHSVYWTLRKDKEEDFYKDVEADIGIKKEFIKWPEKSVMNTLSTGCVGLPESTMPQKCLDQNHWFNAPQVQGFEKGDVINPKQKLQESLENIEKLKKDLGAALWEVMGGGYFSEAEDVDLVDSVMLPIFMFEEGLKSMQQVAEMGKEIKASQEKEFILHMLSSTFFLIGGLGTALAGAGLAQMGRILVLIGEAGGTALGIEGVVSDPTTAPLLIFGLVMSGRAIRDTNNVARAASIRRTMPPWEIEKFSPAVAKKIGVVDTALRERWNARLCR